MNNNAKKGLTLIETLIGGALVAVILATVAFIQQTLGTGQVSAWRNYFSVNDTNSVLRQMVKEIRSAQYSEAGAYPLEQTDDNELVFYSNADADGDIEKIRYTRNQNVFKKGVINPTPTGSYPAEEEKVVQITDRLSNTTSVFTYYNDMWPLDTTGNPLINNRLTTTRSIGITIVIPEGEDASDYTLKTYGQIRILKSN